MDNAAKAMTPPTFRSRLGGVRQQLQKFVLSQNNDRLHQLWDEWRKRIDLMDGQSIELPEVQICFVGGTGAGKSTLLNALIGARVLPVSNMKACTAAISEVGFSEGDYRARIEFVPREAWDREVELLRMDVRSSTFIDADAGESDDVVSTIRRVAFDKLWTVYQPADSVEKDKFDIQNLVEPTEITQALASGATELANSDLDAFRKQISKFLDSKHRFWPIVKCVSIHGPFKALKDGATLVDLPGINDPNEAREAVTRNFLKKCRFVWIVFNIKRALTRDTIELMQSDDFLRQIVMDGRTDSLTFVGTASDDIDAESAIEEFRLDEDCEFAEIVHARNVAVRDVIRDQLDELATRLVQRAKESGETAHHLASRLKASNILTVSAREFLRLEGLAKTNSAGLNHRDETQIPALQEHMRQICKLHGIEARLLQLDRQLNSLLDEVKQEIQSQRLALRNQAEVSEQQRKEIEASLKQAHTFLRGRLEESRGRLGQDLEASQQLLAERIMRAVEKAKHELEDTTLRRWARTHHGTIKATCQRGGAFTGASGRTDFSADLCKPIMEGITFAWSDFFGLKLGEILEKWTERLRGSVDDHKARLAQILDSMAALPDGIAENVANVLDTTQRIIDETLFQTKLGMDAKIVEKQRSIYEHVPAQVVANMRPAFERAADQTGAGMKQRMVEILCEHAKTTSQVMFDDAREALLTGVRGLIDWLRSEYKGMTKAVDRHAELAIETFNVRGVDDSVEHLARQQLALDQFEKIVSHLVNSQHAC